MLRAVKRIARRFDDEKGLIRYLEELTIGLILVFLIYIIHLLYQAMQPTLTKINDANVRTMVESTITNLFISLEIILAAGSIIALTSFFFYIYRILGRSGGRGL
ncbi:MAG: hypothetical protein ACK401_03995 [Archaeoglobaceae archaeon]